jgi:hypothetical protein
MYVFGRILLFSSFALTLAGCLKDAVVTTSGALSIAGPTFPGNKASETYFISAAGDTVSVAGTCHSLATLLEISEDGGMTWNSPLTGDGDCTGDAAFSFTLPNALQTPSNWSPYFSAYSPGDTKVFYLRAQTSFGVTATSTVTVRVPSILSLSISDKVTTEDTSGMIATDADVQSSQEGSGTYAVQFTASAPRCTDNGTVGVNVTTGEVSFTPVLNYNGACYIKISFNNGGATVDDEFLLTVTAVNDLPLITHSCSSSLNQGMALACTVLATDPDGPAVTYSLAGGNTCAWANVNGSGVFSGTPNDNQVGACDLKFKANDGIADSAIESVAFTVNNVVPTLSISPMGISEDSVLTMTNALVQSNEETFGTYSLISSSAPACTSVGVISGINATTGEFTFAPNANYNGFCYINVKFDDGNAGGFAFSEFMVTVSPVNDAPTISPIANQTTAVNTPLNGLAMSLADVDSVVSCNGTYLTATSSNAPLLPPASITFSGAWPNCTISMSPTVGITGATLVTVTVSDGSLNANTSFNFTVTSPALVVQPYYSVATNWNQYVRNDNSDPYALSNTACDGSEATVFGCYHGAEILKVAVPDYSDCTNLTMTDSPHGAFEWECFDMGATVEFRTRELKYQFGLRDFVTSTPAWRSDLTVSLYLSMGLIRSSNPASWWSNPVLALPNASSVAQSLTASGTIYVAAVGDSLVRGYNIAADGIAVVSLAGDRLVHPNSSPSNNCQSTTGQMASPNIHTMVCAGSRKFLWVEAHVESLGTGTNRAKEGVYLHDTIYSQVRNSKIRTLLNTTNAGLTLINSSKNKVFGTEIFDSGNGYYLNASSHNLFFNSQAAKATYTGAVSKVYLLKLSGVSDYNIFYYMRLTDIASINITNPPSGVLIEGSNNLFSSLNISNIGSTTSPRGNGIEFTGASVGNRFTQITVNNLGNSGVKLTSQAVQNVFTHMTIANTGYHGVYFDSTASNSDNIFNSLSILQGDKAIETNTSGMSVSSGVRFSDLAISSVVSSPIIVVQGGGGGFSFDGYLQVNDSSLNCSTAGTNFFSASCSRSGGAVLAIQKAGSATQFVGNGVVDGLNTYGSGSIQSGSNFTAAQHFLSFSTIFRGWGKDDGTAYPNADLRFRGRCGTAESCSIYDWSLKISGATAFLDRSGDGNVVNAVFNSGGGACTSPLNGATDVLTPTTANSGQSFMKNAIELLDGFGDNDGLCESNENCVYAPNIGAYQGHGVLDTSPGSTDYCVVSGANVSSAKVYRYPTNGY